VPEKATVEIAKAAPRDHDGILYLQSRCLLVNLSSDDRKEGFLSAEFPLAQIAAMASDLGVVVARDGGRVVGYMCASRMDFMDRPPILDAMLQCLEGKALEGKVLSEAPTFVYGPVCIDRAWRGRGLLRRMFSALKGVLGGRFEFGVAFVAADNPRSLRAHVNGLGMADVGRFEHGGCEYHALAFVVR